MSPGRERTNFHAAGGLRIRQERIETTAELDDLAARTLEQSALEARVMTDHFFRRVLQLLLVALVGVLVIGLVLRLVGRRARAA